MQYNSAAANDSIWWLRSITAVRTAAANALYPQPGVSTPSPSWRVRLSVVLRAPPCPRVSPTRPDRAIAAARNLLLHAEIRSSRPRDQPCCAARSLWLRFTIMAPSSCPTPRQLCDAYPELGGEPAGRATLQQLQAALLAG